MNTVAILLFLNELFDNYRVPFTQILDKMLFVYIWSVTRYFWRMWNKTQLKLIRLCFSAFLFCSSHTASPENSDFLQIFLCCLQFSKFRKLWWLFPFAFKKPFVKTRFTCCHFSASWWQAQRFWAQVRGVYWAGFRRGWIQNFHLHPLSEFQQAQGQYAATHF